MHSIGWNRRVDVPRPGEDATRQIRRPVAVTIEEFRDFQAPAPGAAEHDYLLVLVELAEPLLDFAHRDVQHACHTCDIELPALADVKQCERFALVAPGQEFRGG